MQLLLFTGQHGRSCCCRLEHGHDFAADCFIQTRPGEPDTWRFPVVQCTPPAHVSQYKRSVTCVGDHYLAPATPTSQQTGQQPRSDLCGTRSITDMKVVGHHVLDLFKLLPTNVALVCVANQYRPLLSWFPPPPATWLSLLILHCILCFAVRIRPCI